MPITITHTLDFNQARQDFPELDAFANWLDSTFPARGAAALVIPNGALPRHLGVETEMMVVLLPDELAPHLEALAVGELETRNVISDDLLTSETLLSIECDALGVDLNVRDIRPGFPGEAAEGFFYIGLAAADRFVVAQHCMGYQWIEAHMAGVQSDCASSGANYNPFRYWSDAELEAAAQGRKPPEELDSFGSRRRVHCAVACSNT